MVDGINLDLDFYPGNKETGPWYGNCILINTSNASKRKRVTKNKSHAYKPPQ